ncbi:exported hypothetical protein [Frankia sp. AgKG'84/4]
MRVRRWVTSVAGAAVLLVGAASEASALPAGAGAPETPSVTVALASWPASDPAAARTAAAGWPTVDAFPVDVSLDTCSTAPFAGDPRLGPAALPLLGDVGRQLFLWSRTGPYWPDRFLSVFWDPAVGGWRYPPQDGFVVRPDGTPVKAPVVLNAGWEVDRYGAEGGRYLAPDGTPYAERSIPPSSLVGAPAPDCNYHEYRVVRPFAVYGGPIAAWFGQPGGAVQYQLDGTLIPGAPPRVDVAWLVRNGFLARDR